MDMIRKYREKFRDSWNSERQNDCSKVRVKYMMACCFAVYFVTLYYIVPLHILRAINEALCPGLTSVCWSNASDVRNLTFEKEDAIFSFQNSTVNDFVQDLKQFSNHSKSINASEVENDTEFAETTLFVDLITSAACILALSVYHYKIQNLEQLLLYYFFMFYTLLLLFYIFFVLDWNNTYGDGAIHPPDSFSVIFQMASDSRGPVKISHFLHMNFFYIFFSSTAFSFEILWNSSIMQSIASFTSFKLVKYVFTDEISTTKASVKQDGKNTNTVLSTFTDEISTTNASVRQDGKNTNTVQSTFTDEISTTKASVRQDGKNTNTVQSTFTDEISTTKASVRQDGKNTNTVQSSFMEEVFPTKETGKDGENKQNADAIYRVLKLLILIMIFVHFFCTDMSWVYRSSPFCKLPREFQPLFFKGGDFAIIWTYVFSLASSFIFCPMFRLRRKVGFCCYRCVDKCGLLLLSIAGTMQIAWYAGIMASNLSYSRPQVIFMAILSFGGLVFVHRKSDMFNHNNDKCYDVASFDMLDGSSDQVLSLTNFVAVRTESEKL